MPQQSSHTEVDLPLADESFAGDIEDVDHNVIDDVNASPVAATDPHASQQPLRPRPLHHLVVERSEQVYEASHNEETNSCL